MTIRQLRLSLGLKQREFAEKFHLNLSTLKSWEYNITYPKKSTAFMIFEIVRLENMVRSLQEQLNRRKEDNT